MRKIVIIGLLIACLCISAFAYDTETVNRCEKNMVVAHQMAECARWLGYGEDHIIIRTASDRWWQEYNLQQSIINEDNKPVVVSYVTEAQKTQYPVASQVWQFLKNDMGLSDPVAAGILGNMMAECGGQTLDLQPYIYGYGYYGLCMWYLEYTNGRLYWGSSVEEQLNYLKDTAEWAFNYWGYDWDYFCSLTDAYSAAYMFEIVYERGTWADIRGWNAYDAQNYFGA